MSAQPMLGTWTITSRIAEGWTRFSAARKSSRVTDRLSSTSGGMVRASRSSCGMIRRTASIAASRASAAMSAPTKPWVVRASSLEVDVLGQRHAAGVDADDLAPPALVGHADDDLAVEPAGAAQRLVDRVGAVGRGDDDDVGAACKPVHQRQQLRDQALLRLAVDLAALGRDRIDLVDEHDRGRGLGGLLEHLAQRASRSRHRPSP